MSPKVKNEEVADVARFIIEKELFPIKVSATDSSAELQRLNYYSDCGFYVASYLFRALITDRIVGDMPNFTVKFSDKNKLKDSLSWLILKIYFSYDEEAKV